MSNDYDLRHAGAIAMAVGAPTAGVIFAGASLAVALAVALIAGTLLGAIFLRAVKPWRDSNHGPSVPGAILVFLGVAPLLMAVTWRVAS